MPEPTFSMTVDDDLPRTIRRERDAQREREARERETREREAQARERQPAIAMPVPRRDSEISIESPRSPPATVVDFDVPIGKLAKFFIKAVFAAIPALLALMALLWV